MKKIHILIIGFLGCLMVGITPSAQAQLNPGDLAIVYFRTLSDVTNNRDTVSFINLVPLSAGEKIYLTTQSAHDNNGGAEDFDNSALGEGHCVVYTVPPGGLPAYSLITYAQGFNGGPGWAEYTAMHGTAIMNLGLDQNNGANVTGTDGILELSIGEITGNQLFLFRANGGTEPASNPVFIYGVDATVNTWLTTPVTAGSVISPQVSLLPPSITSNASIDFNAPSFATGRAAYTGPTTFTSQADALSKISNISNWTHFNFFDLLITPANLAAINEGSSDIHNDPGGSPFSGPTPPSGPTALCQNLTVPLNTSGNASIVASSLEGGSTGGTPPYTFAASQTSFTCSDIGPNQVTLTVTDATTASSNCTANVTITDVTAPTAICQAITVPLNAAGSIGVAKNAMDNGSSDNCTSLTSSNFSISPSTVTCANVGTLTATTTVTDASGISSTCTATMTVEDNNPPSAVCQNHTLNLPGTTGSITASQVNNGSSSVCGIVSLSVSPSTFNCTNLGPNTVTLTVDHNSNGQSSTCTAEVTVADPLGFCCAAPVAACNPVTVELDGSGIGTLAASDAGAGSTADCGLITLSVSPSQFDCNDVGDQPYTLTVTDVNGASSTCGGTVSVQDNIAPDAQCQPATVSLSHYGINTLTTSQINNGSSDNCGIATMSVSKSSFSCSDPNPSTVTLTVTDDHGNTASCNASVTILDGIAPDAYCQGATVELDAQGNGSLAASSVDNGSFDACSIPTLSVSKSVFDCNDLGPNTVTLTVTDQSGNTADCNASVEVQDNIAPTITILGDNSFELCEFDTYTDPGATWSDNCAGTGAVVDVTSTVDENQDGTYTVKYNYTDPSGNAAAEVTRTVIVNPTPEALAQQGCGNCGQIRSTICQFDPAPDLTAYVMNNANYEAGATLNWYADNSNSKGAALPGAPTVDPAKSGTKWYWVEQQVGDCPGPCIRVRVRVKKQFAPEFNLPAIGCGAGAGQIDLAAWVSDPKNKTTLYTFYSVDPVANPGATPVGSATATNGVVDFGQYVIVNVALGAQTYWVQNTVPNGCGSTTSSTLIANIVNATLNFIPDVNVASGAPVNINFSGTNATNIYWIDHPLFSNPNIGIVGMMGLNSMSFIAYNPTTAPLTATIRVIAYNGNCAGQMQDFNITVQPGPPNRQGNNQLQLLASLVNAHDVQLDWQISSEQELIRFEIEKKRNDGDFEAIGYQEWKGDGAYQYTDKSGMSNANEYRLKLIYADGRIVWSETVEVNMNFVDNHRFELFPNPTSGQFQVKALFPMETSFSWQLSDVMGKTLMLGTMEAQQTTIQIESLSTGVYHLTMISPEGKRYLMKLVKQ